MREILFKAKNRDFNIWLYGELHCVNDVHAIYDYELDAVVPIDKETLCQYVGKCDKNGNKIFENDVIQYQLVDDDGTVNIEKFVIKYNEEETRFEQVPIKKCISDGWIDSSCEIIGNIFDKE